MMIYCYLALGFLDKRSHFIPRDHGHASSAMRTKEKMKLLLSIYAEHLYKSDLYFISKLWKLIFVIGLCDA